MHIPGRRISHGDKIYTDWVRRGGDCFIVRAEGIVKSTSGTLQVDIKAYTRTVDQTANEDTQVVATSSDIAIDNTGIFTALYVATSSGATAGAKEEVRLEISTSGTDDGDYYIIRIFPIIFFDNAK